MTPYIDDHVVSLEYAKKLKELKVNQQSFFYYVRSGFNIVTKEENWEIKLLQHNIKNINNIPYYCSAFTASELLNMLPYENLFFDDYGQSHYSQTLMMRKTEHSFLLFYYNKKMDVDYFKDSNLANAAAKCLIWAIENKIVNNPEVLEEGNG